jgi:hypothetical protein
MYISRKDAPASQAILLSGSPVTLGSLVSNPLIVMDPDADAIHCMIEKTDTGSIKLIDLSSKAGIFLNGHRVDVEADLQDGDILKIGASEYKITKSVPIALNTAQSQSSKHKKSQQRAVIKKRPLFQEAVSTQALSPDRRLEVVAYWGNTVLNIDHFHRDDKEFSDVVIGDPAVSHFISGDQGLAATWTLAKAIDDSYLLKLQDGMRAQVRAKGITTKHSNKTDILLTDRDYAHIRHGVIDYFIRYVTPPKVDLPEKKLENKFLAGTSVVGAVIYLLLVGLAIFITPKKIDLPSVPEEPYWQTVEVTPPTVRTTVADIKEELKPIIKQVQPTIKPAEPIAAQKPFEKPEVIKTPNKNIVEKSLPVATQQSEKSTLGQQEKPNTTPSNILDNMANAPNPSLKVAKNSGNQGGPGQTVKNLMSGALKGTQVTSKPGVENQVGIHAAFTDLKSLSGNLGPVLNKSAPGEINVNFRTTGGGTGAKQGSAARDYNLGGTGKNTGLTIPGSGDRVGSWGPGNSGPIGGGTGSIASLRIPGQNHNSVGISLKPQDPLTGPVSLTNEEVLKVIRTNLAQIRHCYEQTLQRSPKIEGMVKVQFTIGSGGRVFNQGILQDSVGDQMLNGCIQGKIARWKFPVPRAGEVNVSYPFDFFRQI